MMNYKGYLAEAVYDPESATYSGIVLNISDTVHFEDDSSDGAEQAFRDSVDDYLDFCEEQGTPPNLPSHGELRIHLDQSVYSQLLHAAHNAGENVDTFVGRYLAKSFREE